jgi:hypothetical protein
MFRSAVVVAVFLAVASVACATSVDLNYTNCTAGVCATGTAPYLLTGGSTSTTNDAHFRYQVPDWSSIESSIWHLNSIIIKLDVYDDGDPANEGGAGRLNVDSAGYGATAFGWTSSCHTCNLNGTTAGSPYEVSVTISDPAELAAILAWLEGHNGHLQYSVNAPHGAGNPSGTFYLADAPAVTLDYTTIPEPATLALIGLGLFGISALRKRLSL